MSEQEAIRRASFPNTRTSLANDLRQLGVELGMVLLVHSSLSTLGWVSGGPVAVLQALMDALTPAGTLVMPAHSSNYSDPAHWENPPVPADWQQTIRDTMPAFDPRRTPTRGVGRIPELFRTWPDVVRSDHPQTSFAAWGRQATAITADHALDSVMGEQSPLARIYDLDGRVLLLGAQFANNSSFHLAEYRLPENLRHKQETGAPVLQNGRRVWVSFADLDLHDDDFPQIGAAFAQLHDVTVGKVGLATCRLFSQRQAVDFAVSWMTRHRRPV